ncbi:hypothetical protein NCAS_0G02960 [Naumovozyma castellii]|uniref:Sulfite efflux pump SSU1 n=1 Tax=Naumovozyma castellii TaxID=27288 RepID=G0VIE8_NAUCA|nr:hypothetical protein NCAS_0G02960 [Naumovozyma castellii CBS 4309]CCC71183.1 hypothetical protein NCAS_0G02960 [Naumovozyma castellii CBS 4309]
MLSLSFDPHRVIRHFEPYLFVMVMGTGISADILYSFPYPAQWLKICSYIMFAIASLLFIFLQIFCIIHLIWYIKKKSFKEYYDFYFRNMSHNVFWGTYPMGIITLLNYLHNLAENELSHTAHSRRIMIFVYAIWWYDLFISLLIAWGITFLIWQSYYSKNDNDNTEDLLLTTASTNLKSVLILAVVPLVVAASSAGLFTMKDLFARTFNRNIQLLTLVITALLWLHALIFVFILITIYFWSLYVNKLPAMSQVFTLFLVLGPLGQGSFGILLLTDNIKVYVEKYYPQPTGQNLQQAILLTAIPWSFKIIGLSLALALQSMGYFFTIICFVSICSYCTTEIQDDDTGKKSRIYSFHKGFWAVTFPMGTMSLGSTEIHVQYEQFVPLSAFRVIGTIYAAVCILWTILCLLGTTYLYIWPPIQRYRHRKLLKGDCDIDSESILPTTNKNELPSTTNSTSMQTRFESH